MTVPRRRAATSPALAAFGRQLRRYRERAGLSQARVATRTGVTPSFVSQVESGKKRCNRKFVEIMDPELKAGGALLQLYDDLADNSSGAAFPSWFDWPSVEAEAVSLTEWQPMIIPGLLQIPGYAATILYGDQEAVAARLARQEIFTREDPPPPMYHLLLEEGVLRRQVGGPEVMREQLLHLTRSVSPRLKIQIVPERGGHLGTICSVALAKLPNMAEIAYYDVISHGVTAEEPEHLQLVHQALMEVRDLAYPGDESLEIIRKVVKERWT
ncbi:helix-turn-helix domain-containing protein [Actinomadura kijaniata]|uniref:helix-turn-helix domain-containing protein n=1 Tax=Actinomadura kijaniata TaxID=46161 RepID=UPI0009FCC249|nr:helix-turn-helix transcriptional regulator [Actinomadura kijaniata]